MKALRPDFFCPRGDALECCLCPRACRIGPGGAGSCRVRRNGEGQPEIPLGGFVTALGRDPIEKKPLYHYRPGSTILSVGFAGCNLHCPFCQNWHISQSTDAPGRFLAPEELISLAEMEESPQVAFTYSEPLVHIEYLLECLALARKRGIATVLVTNGCIREEPGEKVLALTDGANIDLKAFSAETYRKVLGGDLDTVTAFIRRAVTGGVHVEITTLIVPGLNDDRDELEALGDFIADLSPETPGKIPWHLSAYHPDWKWKAPPTPADLILETAARARQKLAYVYPGNIPGESNDTLCPGCGAVLVRRRGYRVEMESLKKRQSGEYYCDLCGRRADFKG
jgi:pyruvate formate lyase activating enzyme